MFIRRIPSSGSLWQSPTSELDRMRREMSRLFDALTGQPLPEAAPGVFPALNVTQDEDKFYVRAELPGVDISSLQISALSRRLVIAGERKLSEEREEASYHRRERAGGVFNRSVTLPAAIDTERVSATYVNGILTVALPKSEEAKPRQVSIKSA